ncbi:N-acetylglucosamine-6-phosphate deacetylase [Neisseria bacilliformis ATCC BAA-1200]|uniref:N-acetylglucosamine-6-phosphate deacetylase n=1 Tax=Neisseria bacilliformis ATCC BAA-1200 TaxID=888742 RepID=F2BD12_9NEIS|nr:N-acetylglucosamine-6-phosphate deacetylase [Neisseria bacilliformis ATCC BAA-1200]
MGADHYYVLCHIGSTCLLNGKNGGRPSVSGGRCIYCTVRCAADAFSGGLRAFHP